MFQDIPAKRASGQRVESFTPDGDSRAVKKSAPSDSPLTLGCRYELKYHITEQQALGIAQFIRPFLQPDRYCKLQPSGSYPIVTLYLDSEDLQLCRQSLEGQKNRCKLRIRSYTDEPDYPRYIEIKRRMNAIIIKSRARITNRDVPTLLAGRALEPQTYTTDTDTINQFQLYMNSLRVRPMILIRYVRQAYEDSSHSEVRVTFDRQLAYNVTSLPEVRLGGRGWQPNAYTLGGVVLEIKFTGHYPAWLGHMVKYFDLQQQSLSKYTSSIRESCLLRFCAPQAAAY
jgi:hypothetical protein